MPPDPGRDLDAVVADLRRAADALVAADPAISDDELADRLAERHPDLLREFGAALAARPEDSGP